MSIPAIGSLRMERVGVRMLHKVCPIKDSHASLKAGHCPECGISRFDYDRFVVGNAGAGELKDRDHE